MKRHAEIRRAHWIGEGKPRKALPKVNHTRAQKKAKRYSTLLGRYRNSRTFHVVEKRADGCCEYPECQTTEGLEHHHRSYARFGGNELPEDIVVLCRAHHHLAESIARPWRRRGKVQS